MRTRTSFYDECQTVDASSDAIVKTAPNNTCLGPRRCENAQSSADGIPYVGYDPFGTCTCDVKKNTVSTTYAREYRYKRETNESFRTVSMDCHVERASKGGKRKACDTNRLIRQNGYTEARKIATNEEDLTKEDDIVSSR